MISRPFIGRGGCVMIHRWLCAVVPIALSGSIVFAGTFTVTVKAFDAENKPVAKADVSLFWQMTDGAMTPRDAVITGADGKAVLRVDDWNNKRPVMVLSADRSLGAMLGVSKADDGKELTATLTPTVHVKGKLECKELSLKPEW